jgi:hypothetical protein
VSHWPVGYSSLGCKQPEPVIEICITPWSIGAANGALDRLGLGEANRRGFDARSVALQH